MDILSTIGVADIVAVVILLFAAFHGLHRGLSGELAQVVGIVVAIAVGFVVFAPLGTCLVDRLQLTPAVARVAASVATLAVSMIAMIIVVTTLKRVLEFVIGETLDRILGFVAGVVRGAVIVVVLFLVMNIVPSEKLNHMFGEGSYIGSAVIQFLPFLRDEIEVR